MVKNKMYKYESIARDLETKIINGDYVPDERLPQESELCKMYDASRITVREAMNLLVNKGLIIKRRGSGTFVKAVVGGAGFTNSLQFNGFTRDMGMKVKSEVQRFNVIPASELVADKLQIEKGAFVYDIVRTRLVKGKPYVVEYTYMPIDFITGITDEVIHSSIYEHIEEKLNLKIKSAHRVARADMPTPEEKKWLAIETDQLPILEVEQVAFLDDGRIFEYSKSRHRGDCFELKSISMR